MSDQHKPVNANPRNVINEAEIDEWIAGVLDNKQIKKGQPAHDWCCTVLRKYLLKQHPHVLPVLPVEQRGMLTWIQQCFLQLDTKRKQSPTRFSLPHFESTENKPWLAEAFRRGDFVCKVILQSELQDRVEHILDFITSRTWTDVTRASFDQIEKSTHKWLESLLQQKTIESDLKHVLIRAEKVINGKSYKLVELLTPQAYSLEGKRMHNCVASYFVNLPTRVKLERIALSETLKAEQEELKHLRLKVAKFESGALTAESIPQQPARSRATSEPDDDALECDDEEECDDDDDDEEGYCDAPLHTRAEKVMSLDKAFRGIWSLRDENNYPLLTIEMWRYACPSPEVVPLMVDAMTGTSTRRLFIWFTPQVKASANNQPTPELLAVLDEMWSEQGIVRCTHAAASEFLQNAKKKADKLRTSRSLSQFLSSFVADRNLLALSKADEDDDEGEDDDEVCDDDDGDEESEWE